LVALTRVLYQGFPFIFSFNYYSASLRTTVPASIVKQFNLKDGDKLEWILDIKDGRMVILVNPTA